MPRTYKIRSFQNGQSRKGRPFINYSLTLPGEIAQHVPDDIAFTCELTEHGVLYRPVVDQPRVTVPAWAQRRPDEIVA